MDSIVARGENVPASALEDVTIVVPAYNELAAIGATIDGLRAAYPKVEILVVDDGSTDGTADIARQKGVRLASHDENRGYGASWKTGLRMARTKYVIFFDGDNQFAPQDVGRIYHRFITGGADMVSGQRTSGSHVDLARAPGKILLSWVSRTLVGRRILDLNCGLRMYDRARLTRYVPLLPNGFSASATSLILYFSRGYNVEFVKVVTKKRLGKSSVSILKDGINTIMLILRLVALFNPIRIFGMTALTLFFLGAGYSLIEAAARGLGIPVLGAVFLITGVLVFLVGFVCDQIASLRLEFYELSRNSKSVAMEEAESDDEVRLGRNS